ncbi:MAG: DMT family transporter [Chloroflexi bacterium]|nr:DMT family transporter [Chloroflexota bacterium]MDA1241190.1 DMT family transporter [Chloroflexota bacterium]
MGELAALASAVGWAGTSTALARLGGRYDAPVLSALRLLAATPLLIVFLMMDGGFATLGLDDAPIPVLIMVLSGLVGYGIGDTAYIRSLATVGIQRMAPTTTALWVAMSAVGGIVLLGEPFTWSLVVGGVAVVAGCAVLMARAVAPLGTIGRPAASTLQVVIAVTVVAAAWAAATLMLAGGREELSTAAAGAIRIPTGGLVIAAVTMTAARGNIRHRLPQGRDLALIVVVGILGTGIGSWLYIFAIAEAGASKAVILNATSPLMAIPLAMFFLHERPTRRIAAGTALCVLGTLVVIAG